jgi:glucosamine-6-phosphate deaminase
MRIKKSRIETRAEFRKLEKLPVEIHPTFEEVSIRLARLVTEEIEKNDAEGRQTVIGLVTGSFVVGVYREWVRMREEEGFDFSNVVAFNLDEYFPITADSLQSHQRFMRENLFDRINIPEDNIHFLPSEVPKSKVDRICAAYEEKIKKAGGVGIQLLEVGRLGHIGFDVPGNQPSMRTRLAPLDEVARKKAAVFFFSEENVPEFIVTMGLGTLLEARRICLMAIGDGEAELVERTVEGAVSDTCPTSYLQRHPNATVYVDEEAAGELTRVKEPWSRGDLKWNADLKYRAVIHLSQKTGIPISKLESVDYTRNHLAGLLRQFGPADRINTDVAKSLTDRIWHTSDFFKNKRALIFSPHPDDDVICMGGTIQKLVARENRVDVAVMTSGNLAVFDEDALRHLEFIERVHDSLGSSSVRLSRAVSELMECLKGKRTGQMDSPGVQDVKRIIRESEAVAAVESLGIGRERVHFLDLPFYRTGRVKKDPVGEPDVKIVLSLLRKLKPDVLFAAGDMTDPHGTHRMCFQALEDALERLEGDKPAIWLYRGAWQEWEIHDVDVFTPLSKSEAKKKTLAIFKHESQKDRPVFPGPYDEREFWQRAEERNRGTAQALDRLGLQEYFALEAFVVENPGS